VDEEREVLARQLLASGLALLARRELLSEPGVGEQEVELANELILVDLSPVHRGGRRCEQVRASRQR
jgi:hypothetical protein